MAGAAPEEEWSCSACTFFNPLSALFCTMCDTPIPMLLDNKNKKKKNAAKMSNQLLQFKAYTPKRDAAASSATTFTATHPNQTYCQLPKTKLNNKINKNLHPNRLNPNFHLIVKPDHHTSKMQTPKSIHPDQPPPEWTSVHALRLNTHEDTCCPICLSETPTAPQVGPCGHIVCLVCALRLIDATGSSLAKCPICAKDISHSLLRPVSIVRIRHIARVGADLRVRRLCISDKHGASPILCLSSVDDVPALVAAGHSEVSVFDSLTTAQLKDLSSYETIGDANRKSHVQTCMVDSKVCPTPSYASATQLPHSTVRSSEVVNTAAEIAGSTTDIAALVEVEQAEIDHFVAKAQEHVKRRQSIMFADGSGLRRQAAGNVCNDKSTCGTGWRYTLQAASGELVFVDSLTSRMLVEHFGNWDSMPEHFCAQVVELTVVRQDEATRKRHKGAAHLPLCSEYRIAQLDVSNIVSDSVLATFSAELKKRKARRRSAAAQERRLVEEARRAVRNGAAPDLRALTLEEHESLRKQREERMKPDVQVGADWHETWHRREEAATGPSFSRMVADGFIASGPTLEEAALSSSPSQRSPAFVPMSNPTSPSLLASWTARAPDSSSHHLPSAREVRVASNTSMLRQPSPPQDLEEEGAPPSLAASWAMATTAAGGKEDVPKRKGKKGPALLISNSGGRKL